MLSTRILVSVILCSIPADPQAPKQANAESNAFFNDAKLAQIRIQLESKQLEKLKAEPRSYVQATIQENDRVTYQEVAIKLKGAAGSFREWDDRPALTINMKKFHKGGNFHGLVKFHLNNSIQDKSYLTEILCSELFRKAGIPAPRVTHARVWLNGRDVGLYVLKEGFDRSFLKSSFPDPTGNLYDGGFLQDLNADLEKDEGSGPDDRSDLRAIVEAAADPDPLNRVARIEKLVDMDAFLSFMAMERMTCHWDGYTDKANNYRIYFPPRGKAIFLPHGMDQMFADPQAGLFDPSDKIVAAVVFKSDALMQRYRERLRKLLPLVSPADVLTRRVDEIERRLRPVLDEMGHGATSRQKAEAVDLKARLVARSVNLRKQLPRR